MLRADDGGAGWAWTLNGIVFFVLVLCQYCLGLRVVDGKTMLFGIGRGEKIRD